jgi:hypothetical protein
MGQICLLAPVPEEHLVSGLEVCLKQGKVAFGTRAWETFFKLNELLKPDNECDVLIYASDSATAQNSPSVTWRAKYIGYTEAKGGAHKSGMTYRPPTTASYPSDNQGYWALFWEVSALEKLKPEALIPIGTLLGYDRPRKLLKNFIPHGPTIVEMALGAAARNRVALSILAQRPGL